MHTTFKRWLVTGLIGTMGTLPMMAHGYSYSGYHWNYGNPTFVAVTFDNSVPFTWNTALSRSMSAWSTAGAKFRFGGGYAGHIVRMRDLGWSPGNATLGVTTTWVSGTTIVNDNTDLNSRAPWGINGESNRYDVQSVLTHEFGHWLNLRDLYASSDYWKTMYWTAGMGETYKRTLDSDDINGIRAIYGI